MAQDDLAMLGDILRSARLEAGLSIRQLAKHVGVHHSYIGHIENGLKSNPSAELLQKLAEVLNLDANELLAHIGLRPSSILPPLRVYFRQKFDTSEDEADVLAQIVEYQMEQGKETGASENTHPKGGE
jgi:transcriptional regulator with XRE-family HTH domain